MNSDKKNTGAEYPLLDRISSPEDVKAMDASELPALAEEIRRFLIARVHENGGHLASNLGIVEATIAIHRVFSTPHDHLIFDVGHQSYVHKLLTGRRDRFDTLRQGGGLSGFPKREESEHDCFGTGHSSTSLSAALGFAESDKLSGSDAYTVCMLGDGAYTGGMVHEAMNNNHKKLRLIIVLNENEMSISKNIGRFAKNLSKLRSSKHYFTTKSAIASFLKHIPLIGEKLFDGLLKIKMMIKSALYGSNYFENLGFYYLGPVDGNDEVAVERLLEEAKACHQSCVVHIKTKKGKGYAPAEGTPDLYHGMSPAGASSHSGDNFSAVMGNALVELASKNDKICAITAAMTGGTGLQKFRSTYPARFFDVGIAEEHAVTFAAGLAANGYLPVVAIYSTFLQRAYDNIIHDVALQKLPVVFCVDRAGLNASDGATHHGIFDVAFLSEVPNLTIYTPVTNRGLVLALRESIAAGAPCAIRYPNGYEDERIVSAFGFDSDPNRIGVRCNDSGAEEPDAVVITHGRIAAEALTAAKRLMETGIRVRILLLEKLKPYDEVAAEVAAHLPEKSCPVLFLEEEIRAGGMGMLLSDALRNFDVFRNKKSEILALDDHFGIQTRKEPILHSFGLDADGISAMLRRMLTEQSMR